MKAIGVMTFGGPEVLHIVELPEPHAGAGEVRIRVHAASVNPTDTLFRAGSQAARLSGRPGPYVPGMDAAGVIDELGPETDSRLKVGDRVVAFVIPAGPHGGAYAEYVVVPAASVVLAPAGVDFPAASTLLLNGLTARLALDALALDAGQTMAVTGAAGAFGGSVIQLAKADGLTVIADASRSDQTLVRSLGADYVLERAIPSPNVFARSSRKGFPALPMVQGSITWRCPQSPTAARWPSFSDGTDRPSVTSPCTKSHRPP